MKSIADIVGVTPDKFPDFLINFESLSDTEKERLATLEARGYYCEQTAEFAAAIHDEDYRVTNYHRAFNNYLQAGLFRKAAEVVVKIPSECLLREVKQKYDSERAGR